ncbi:hypothetical protein [Parapedobacter pyrenivorans]|uniref:hypothetical protein n=1 Tax=Parapedobacter pyrenivorans TaxID=1305674 RepID=UPI00166C7EF1
MRNSLLNYGIPKATGLHIIQEKSSAIFDILVSKGKSTTFLGRPHNITFYGFLFFPDRYFHPQ